MVKKANYAKGFRAKSVKVKNAKGRKISSTNWLRRQLNDPFTQLARKDGYRARSAYKLLELDDKYSLLKDKKLILDLGCAPGGWLQVSRERNSQAVIIGIDLLEVDELPGINIIEGDFSNSDVQDKIFEYSCDNKIDLIISDIAPATSGVPTTDCLKLLNIAEDIFIFSKSNLNKGGDVVFKIFMGIGTDDFIKLLKQNFSKVTSFKPSSSRKNSKEFYLIAKGFYGDRDNVASD